MTNSFDLYHGHCVSYMTRMEEGSVDLIVTSPPYINQGGFNWWEGSYPHFLMDIDDWIGQCARVLKPGRYCFWNVPDKIPNPTKDGREYWPIYSDSERLAIVAGLVPEFPIIWSKTNGAQRMLGSFPYPPTIIHTSTTERICVWRKPGKAVQPDKEIKEASRIRKEDWNKWAVDVWNIPGSPKKWHPATFPLEIPHRIVTMWSFVNDLVFDPFTGSGTTGEAALLLCRRFAGCELQDEYYAMARLQLMKADAAFALTDMITGKDRRWTLMGGKDG